MPLALNDVVAVILAGGYGTRVQHLLPNLPKPMAPVAGKPFVEWAIRYLAVQGFAKTILATGYLAEIVEEHFQAHPVKGVEILCCREIHPLGTAGGFLNAVHQSPISAPAWLVMNGDSLVFTPLAPLNDYLSDPTVDGAIVGLQMADASRYGSLVCNERGDLICFAEKRSGAGIINGGIFLLRHSLIEKFPKKAPLSFEKEVFPALLADGVHFKVHTVDAPFLDIGTPESLPQAEEFILHNASQLKN